MSHCPACEVAGVLKAHRDTYAAEWSARRAAFTFALILAQRACPDYEPETRREA